MGFGSSGGVKAHRLPVVLIYLTISCVVLLALGACGGEDPTPVPPPTTPPVVIAAPPVQPPPTLPPLPAQEPVAEPSGPVSTPLVVVPGSRFWWWSRARRGAHAAANRRTHGRARARTHRDSIAQANANRYYPAQRTHRHAGPSQEPVRQC